MADKFGYSSDEENYQGDFDSREAAIAEAKAYYDGLGMTRFWTARQRAPRLDLGCLDADHVIESIVNSEDDFMIDAAEDWPPATSSQVDDLTFALQGAFRDWMARYKLEPAFWIADDVQEHRIDDE